jgi:predicted Fe-Mo cluster-binding NifX family protein
MKIAVATNDNIHVTGHLGRCRTFLVYSVEDNKIVSREERDNTFTHHHAAGHEHGEEHHHGEEHNHSHSALIDGLKDCSAVIFQSGGWRVVEDLKQNNIRPFLTDELIADDAAAKFLKGELTERPENTCRAH